MTLNQLLYIITIADEGSLNKAAEKLYMTQPTLTSSLRDVEAELGVTIFRRTGRGVTVTNDGAEFLQYARQLYGQYESLMGKYSDEGGLKTKFGVSTQHYSFAIKAFVEMVKGFDMDKYEFAIREARTHDVIHDVVTGKSEIGILYTNDFNEKVLNKIFKDNQLEFVHLFTCEGYAYLWKNHPLAGKKVIALEELQDYPCLSFEQGDNNSFYFAEEILSTYDFKKTIKSNDRATNLNLMVGLNAFTLCSGIICEELNGSDYIAVKLAKEVTMDIGYIKRAHMNMSEIGELYIEEIKKYVG